MKTVVKAIDLSNAVGKVVKAISGKGQNPVLECIKLSCKGDNLTLLATDTEISIEKTIPAETFMEGETLVNGKIFADLVKKLEGEDELELYLEGNRLKITYSSSCGYINAFGAEDFPLIKKDLNENSFTILQKDFKDLVSRTAFCCLQDDSRPILKGCLIEAENDMINCVALDGFRLAFCRQPYKELHGTVKAIVPSRALNELLRLLEKDEEYVTIIIQGGKLMVEVSNTVLTARLLEGEYIDYKHIIPEKFVTEFRTNKIIFENAVARASVVARAMSNNMVILDVKEDYVNVTSNSEIGTVNENVLINLEGKDVTIAFNSRYIIDCLHAISDDFIKFSLNSPIAPCIIRPNSDDNSLYLVLPIRMN